MYEMMRAVDLSCDVMPLKEVFESIYFPLRGILCKLSQFDLLVGLRPLPFLTILFPSSRPRTFVEPETFSEVV